jgi:tetratricopeptide (TPR) repeat protein
MVLAMKNYLYLITIAGCLILGSCSGGEESAPVEKTAAQLTAEGWQAYSGGIYATAAAKFSEALTKDANFVDAYNGLGWARMKLNTLATALSSFSSGLTRDTVNLEIMAGLAFLYHAQKNYSQSILLADNVLQANSTWAFSRDAAITSADLHLLLAEDYFAQASYAASLQQVQVLDGSFTADISTVAGQEALAKRIEELRGIV